MNALPPKSSIIARSVPVLVLLLANVLVFHEYWTAERLFTGKDLLTAFEPLLNFQTDCLREGSLPLWNPFLNFGYPFVEHYSNTMLFPTHLLMGLFTGSSLVLVQREMLFWIFLGGLGVYWCARELGRSRTAAVAAGMSFMFCGQVVSLPHWHLLVYNASCFPFLLLGYHRAVRQERPVSLMTILFLAFTLFGGHITTSVLGLYLFGGYVLADSLIRKRMVFGVQFLAISAVTAGLLALPKLAPMYHAMRSGPRMLNPASLHTKDPFNVINSYQFMSLVLPVKYFFSLYLGQLPVLAAVFAVIRRNVRVDALLVLAVLSGWFLMVDDTGTVSLLRSAANVLPLMNLVRNEWLVWFYPSVFAILHLSGAVDQYLAGPFSRAHVASSALVAASVAGVYLFAYNPVFAPAAAVHIALAGAALPLPLFRTRENLQFVAVSLVVILEFFLVFSRVAPDEPPLRDATRMQVFVIDQGSIGKRFTDDNRILSGFTAEAVQDRLRPPISDSVKWPRLYSGLHGAPFINYAPEQYGMFIDDMNLKRFSGWWYNGQERFDFIKLKDSPRLAQMDGLPLFTFINHSGSQGTAAISFDGITCSSFLFHVETHEPGLFLLHQMYDDRWQVRVDRIPEKIVPADDFFMGVMMQPGRHVLEFAFRDRIYRWSSVISLLTLAGVLCWPFIQRRWAAEARRATPPA